MYAREQIETAFNDRDRMAEGMGAAGGPLGALRILKGVGLRDPSAHRHDGPGRRPRGRRPEDVRADRCDAHRPGRHRLVEDAYRWIRLALTDDERHRQGRMLLPEHARGWLAALDAGYKAPRRSLRRKARRQRPAMARRRPTISTRRLRTREIAFAVFHARHNRQTLADSIKAATPFWYARHLYFE